MKTIYAALPTLKMLINNRKHGTKLILFHVNESAVAKYHGDSIYDTLKINKIKGQLKAHFSDIKTVLAFGHMANSLILAVEQNPVDLLIVVTHVHNNGSISPPVRIYCQSRLEKGLMYTF